MTQRRCATGIYAYNTITINGGTVSATATSIDINCNGLGGKNVNIAGGIVTAKSYSNTKKAIYISTGALSIQNGIAKASTDPDGTGQVDYDPSQLST